jgi:hypothetical protein
VADYYTTSVKKSAKQLTADLEIALKKLHEEVHSGTDRHTTEVKQC